MRRTVSGASCPSSPPLKCPAMQSVELRLSLCREICQVPKQGVESSVAAFGSSNFGVDGPTHNGSVCL
jgi:hypothetical protein